MTCEIGPACECDDHGQPRVDVQAMLDMRERLSTRYREQLERLTQRGLLRPRAVNDLCAGFADGLASMIAAIVAGTADHGVATAVNAAFPQASARSGQKPRTTEELERIAEENRPKRAAVIGTASAAQLVEEACELIGQGWTVPALVAFCPSFPPGRLASWQGTTEDRQGVVRLLRRGELEALVRLLRGER